MADGDRLIIYPILPSKLKGIGLKAADGTDATDYVGKLRKEREQRR